VARALTEVVHTRYGQYLTPEQLNDVQDEIERGLRISERLRARKLKNSDEPDFVFSATSLPWERTLPACLSPQDAGAPR